MEQAKPKVVKKIIDGLKHVKHGFKVTYKDGVYWSRLVKINNKTVTEMRDYERIKVDLLQMLPFSAFMVIPLGELFLPAYIKVFPNAIPKGFITPD